MSAFTVRLLPFSRRIILPTLAVIIIATDGQASYRAEHLRNKLEGPGQVITLNGQYVHNIGDLQMNVTYWGFFGSLPKSRMPMSDSPSAQWPAGSGVEYLYAAGIWVGATMDGFPAVSTGYPETEFYPTDDPRDIIYRSFEGALNGCRYPGPADDDMDGLVDEDWLNGHDDDHDGYIDEDYAAIGQQMLSCWYTDDQPYSTMRWPEHTPMHLHIRQESYQWGDDNINDFIGVHYYITNQGTKFLTNAYIGIYADVDAGPVIYGSYHMDDLVGFWQGWQCAIKGEGEMPVHIKVGYVYDNDGDGGRTRGYFGIVILGHTTGVFTPSCNVSLNAFRVFRGLQPYEKGGEPTSDFQRYDVLTNQQIDDNKEDPNDYKILLSVGPFGILPPDSTIELSIAYVCGEGLDEMLLNAAKIKLAYEGRWYNEDKDYNTGILGRETPVPGPLKLWDPDPCDADTNKLNAYKGEIIWSNIDCYDEYLRWSNQECYKGGLGSSDYQTGIHGKEKQLHWFTASAPPPPRMRVIPGDNEMTILWDNLSETVPDMMTLENDFEGYQIWRADNWHRPYGTSTLSGPHSDLWHLLEIRDIINGILPDVDFKRPFSEGGWQYEPLVNFKDRETYIRLYKESLLYSPLDTVPCPPGLTEEICDTLEALARHSLGMAGGKQYYKYVDKEPKNGLPYFYSVIAYDHVIEDGTPTKIGRSNNPISNFAYVTPLSEAQHAESFDEKEVYVVPNPATRDNLKPWKLDPNNSDPTGVKVEFRNLPRCQSTVRIFTVSGDLVQTLYNDGRDGNGTLPWNLLSRNGQDIGSGVYLFSVEPADSRFPRTIGKFVVIR
jgi:hypothetical protein